MSQHLIYRILLTIAITIGVYNTTLAQESVYSLLGLGDRLVTTNPRLEGIASSGAALLDPRTINDINPAAWSWLTRTRLEARVSLTTNETSLGDQSTLLHNIRLNGFSFGSPFSDAIKGTFALGFNPVSYSIFTVVRTDSLNTTIYERQGGISQLFIGAAMRPHSGIALGARLDVLFGNATALTQITPTNALALSSVFERKYATNALRGTFGISLAADSIVSIFKGITIGASYSTSSPLSITRRTKLQPTNSTLDSTIEDMGYSEYPSVLTLGIGSRFGDRYRAEIDYSTQDFSAITTYSPTESWIPDTRLTNSTRYSIGVERLPLMGEDGRNQQYFDRIGLRIGFAFATLPYKPDGQTVISEMSASLGFNLPLGLETMFDLSLTFGQRTPSTQDILPKEQFIRIGASLSLSERWFVPSRTEEE